MFSYGDHTKPIRVHLQAPYHHRNVTRDQRKHNKTMSEVRPTAFGLRSVERIYLLYGILENAKACLYCYKTDDVFETNPVPYVLLQSRDKNL